MHRTFRTIALLLALAASLGRAANYVETFTYPEDLELWAYSYDEEDFGDYASDRVAVTGGTLGLYSVTLDSNDGTRFAIFEGASTPTSWDDAVLDANILDQITKDAIDDVEGGGGTIIPVNQVAVPKSRTWILERTGNGLEGVLPIGASIGEGEQVFAIDFAKDLPTNGRLVDVVSVEPYYAEGEEEPEDPVVTIDAESFGVDKALAKFKATPESVGSVTLRVVVSYGDQDGGGTAVAFVTLPVTR
jgi:hypothetical protein